MKWQNVKLILWRELKDQFRDRRTLFTVLVLPLLLYPLMGMALLQISQFARQHSSRIWVAGHENLPVEPAFIVDQKINPALLNSKSEQAELLFAENDDKVFEFFKKVAEVPEDDQTKQATSKVAQLILNKKQADLAIIIPAKIEVSDFGTIKDNEASVPKIMIFRNSAKDKSNIAAERFQKVLLNWKQKISQQILAASDIDASKLESFKMVSSDVADKEWKQAATWSKILPFIVMIWSLTGAFYPAVDLCAGEKERGHVRDVVKQPCPSQ